MDDPIHDILGPDGAVARRLGAAYEPRPQQLEMAYAVREALGAGEHLLVEAGTGVGKSFAYLLPAIELATKQKKRVVISTHTISLQEQLIDKDIPLLASLYPDEFTAVLVKGRGNYLCRRRADAALANRQMLFEDDKQMRSLAAIGEWARKTSDGSLASLPVLPEPGVWDEVRAEHGNCLGKRCTHFEGCFWQAAKRRMNGGNILVVNHALFFSDLALRSAGVQYLPKYDAVIFDEAHTIEDVAGQHFAIKLSEFTLRYQLKQLYDLRKGKGLLATLPAKTADEAIAAVCDAAESAQQFFDAVAVWQTNFGRANGRVNTPDIVDTDLPDRLNDAAKLVRNLLTHIKQPETVLELTSKADRLTMAAQTVEILLKQSMPDAVYWIELTKRSTHRGTAQRVTLSAAPVDVSHGLRSHLFDRVKGIVMTSATLCTGKVKASAAPASNRSMSVPLMPNEAVVRRRGAKLPHWTKANSSYAVTFRLADAIPAGRVSVPRELNERFASNPRQLMEAVDQLLEESRGECLMRQPAIAQTVADAIKHFAGERYQLLGWAVMPNHVHMVLSPAPGQELPAILHSIKSFTAHRINGLLGREGNVWDHESFDHLVRDADDLHNQVRYASENPSRAHLEDWNWCGEDWDAVERMVRGVEQDAGHERDAHATAEDTTFSHEPPAQPKTPPAFTYIARRLGVGDGVRTLQLGSPFDYAKQATLYLETNLPDPNDGTRFLPAACDKVEHYVRHTHGGAFVLFTSFAMLRQAADRLRPTFEHMGLPVLVQGVDGAPRQLLQRFRELDDCVLFGTSSFWQGIDVQGSRLRNVIITKLPFAVPDEPLVEAKLEDVTRRGGNAFMDLTLPEAIIRFKQGFGRLIRSKADKGIVVVLDSRVKTKRYGRQFMDALPDVRVVEVKD